MASYIKSKVQQSLSFLLVLVIAFSVFSGVLFLNPSPSYAYSRDLSRVNYSGADLRRANFSDARLDGANFSGADLRWAKLSGADLRRANFSDARLDGADLSGTKLSRARLDGADLSGAILFGAIADSRTIFPDGFDAVGAGVRFFN